MKRIILPILAIILTIACKPAMTPEEFIEDMYDNHRYEDYTFLEKHCSAKLLDKLSEAYDYDGDGYASWLFRSGAQDGPNDKYKLNLVYADGDWYNYEGLDMGNFFRRSIRLSVKGSRYIIEDVCGLNLIGVTEFASIISLPGVVCIDLRPEKDYIKGHIPGAINIYAGDEGIMDKVLATVTTDKTIAIYGRSRQFRSTVAQKLARLGYRGYELLGGYNFWPAMGQPVETAD